MGGAAREVERGFTYTGQRDDAYTQLTIMGTRYYDPRIGRWVSPDSIIPDPANSQSYNRYSYVNNRPINLIDPSGHIGIPAFDPGVGGEGTKKEDFGISELSNPEELFGAFKAGYIPFADPEYMLADNRMNHPIFADYYLWALGNDAWLPLRSEDREDWTKYWPAVTGHSPHIGELASDPGFVTTIGMAAIGAFKAGHSESSTQLIWSGTPHNPRRGHWAAIETKAQNMLGSEEYEKIYINKATSTATGRQIRDLGRPDIVGVRPDGSYHLVEVVNPISQTRRQLQIKCESMSETFGGLAVTYEVIMPGGR